MKESEKDPKGHSRGLRIMSKGSSPRPLSVPREKFNESFDRIFRKKLGECNRLEAEVTRVKGEIEANVSEYLAKFGLVRAKPHQGKIP